MSSSTGLPPDAIAWIDSFPWLSSDSSFSCCLPCLLRMASSTGLPPDVIAWIDLSPGCQVALPLFAASPACSWWLPPLFCPQISALTGHWLVLHFPHVVPFTVLTLVFFPSKSSDLYFVVWNICGPSNCSLSFVLAALFPNTCFVCIFVHFIWILVWLCLVVLFFVFLYFWLKVTGCWPSLLPPAEPLVRS